MFFRCSRLFFVVCFWEVRERVVVFWFKDRWWGPLISVSIGGGKMFLGKVFRSI